MVDHEKCGNLNVLEVFEDEIVVEEELELSLDEVYTIFKEEHDSFTLEPIYDKGFIILKELHDTTHMDPSHDETSDFFIIWVSYFILLHPMISCFAALVAMKYG